MTNEHKLRQEMFHALETTDDGLEDKEVIVKENQIAPELICDIVDYFTRDVSELIYPAKSYAVAIIYASLIEHHFEVDFLTALSDPTLLFGNDPHFIPYSNSSKGIYNAVLGMIPPDFNMNLPQVRKTVEYFYEEFYIEENPYFSNDNIA